MIEKHIPFEASRRGSGDMLVTVIASQLVAGYSGNHTVGRHGKRSMAS